MVTRLYIKWRKGKISRRKYVASKKNLREYLENKRKEKRSKVVKELRNLKNDSKV